MRHEYEAYARISAEMKALGDHETLGSLSLLVVRRILDPHRPGRPLADR